jgi:hypothetical protein
MEDFISASNIELLYENEDTPIYSITMDPPKIQISLHPLMLLNLLQEKLFMIQDVDTGW